MRLAFIANGLSYGGAEKMLVFVATELLKRGHEVAIFNTNEHKGVSQTLPDELVLFNAKANYKKNKWAYLKRLCFCIRSTRHFKPDVIIGFLLFPNLYSVLTGKFVRIPSVISERADPYLAFAKGDKFGKFLLNEICSADGAVFQTTGASLFYPKELRERSAIIPNPVVITKEYTKTAYAERENIVVSLGRIDNRQKRLDILLDAFSQFHLKHSEYVLYIFGGGPDEEYVQDLINEKGLENCVSLKGVSKNSFEDISKGKIFAITSDYEGISNSLLEAMAVGMPVVSTDHSPGGACFLIKDGENGLLTPVGNASKFAEAMCRYAEDEVFAVHCGEKASEVLKDYAPSVIIDLWEKYLYEIVKRH